MVAHASLVLASTKDEAASASQLPSIQQNTMLKTPTALPIGHWRTVTIESNQTIQATLDNLPQDNSWALVTLGPGVFQEQLFITRDKTIIVGRGKNTTVLRYGILREHFLNSKKSNHQPNDGLPRGAALQQDWGAAVINVAASDIVLLDLTVHNSYALENPTDPKRFDHQFAIRGFQTATRILTDHVNFTSAGADTVSLWNKQDGMYYHANGQFSGRVDLMCPRGSAFITNSEFVNLKAVATLWHDGELNAQHKIVISHSRFLGVTGFELGRHHYDGQFYLLYNQFSQAMADTPIYRRTYPEQPWRDQPNRFGKRYYFFGNRLAAEHQYPWLADNISERDASHVSPDWTFNGAWQPEKLLEQIRHSLLISSRN